MKGCWRAHWLPLLSLACFSLACLGACGGDGDKAPSYTPVSVTSVGDLYTLQLGDVKMVVDASRGARITEFSLDGDNVLLTKDENSSYGSTFWPSPQSSWCAAAESSCWPPAAAIDMQPYTGGVENEKTILLTSGTASLASVPGSAVVVSKRFTPEPDHGAVDVTYTLANNSQTADVSVAPWQISRVATGGLTFFGKGAGPVTYAPDSDPAFVVTEAGGVLWYPSAPVTHNSKLFADSNGSLAHVTPTRLLHLESFPNVEPADAAPGEAEIEVFTSVDYIELEGQGPLTALSPGQALVWTVRWQLRPVPTGMTVEAGNDALASYAFTVLAE